MQQSLNQVLAQATNPAVLCSFGKDSLLLLQLALNGGFSGPVYYFGERLPEHAEQMIIDGLTVYSWPATNRYVVPNGEGLAQVDEYLLGEALIPLVSPITEGGDCDHGEWQRYLSPFKWPHDVTLTGYKHGETCAAVGMDFPAEINLGLTRLVNPLYEFSDSEVREALGRDVPDDNAVEYCAECLTYIDNNLDRDAALAGFRHRFSFNEGDNQWQ